jgi:uncharacterized membrane protein
MSIPEESRVWAAFAWALFIIGAIIALVMKPRDEYVRYWALESIGFTVVVIVMWILVKIVSLALAFTLIIPIALNILYALGVILAWVIGILKAFSGSYWQPPIIHETTEWIKRIFKI